MKFALLGSFKGYNAAKFVRDLMSGLLVAIIALPLSIALGIQSGVTLQQGIITAIVAGFFISLAGGSRFQIGGPTAAFVAIIVGYVSDPEIGLLGLQVATVMAGMIMLLMAVFRIGGIVKYIPYPIVVGFTSGIGLTLLVGQLGDFTAIRLAPEYTANFFTKVYGYIVNIPSINLPTLALGALTILIMVFLPKLNKKIPAGFVALIVTTIISTVIGVFVPDRYGIATISSAFGKVEADVILPDFSAIGGLNFAKLILPAFVIAFLASIESLLSATVADGMTNTKHDSNAELVGQGLANIASALCGGLPATGAIARTAANIKNGGTTPIAGIIHALVLLLMFFLLMPLVGYIPLATLAGILIMVSVSMANFKLFAKLLTFNIRDSIILVTTFMLTVAKDLIWGVLAGLLVTLVLMLIDMVKKIKIDVVSPSAATHLEGIGSFAERNAMAIVKLSGNITFHNANKVITECDKILATTSGIVIDMSGIDRCDLSGVDKISKYVKNQAINNHSVNICKANRYVARQFKMAIEL